MSGPGESLSEQAETTYRRLQAVLGSYGLSMANVAQERVFLLEGQALGDFKARRSRFYASDSAPASSIVFVAGLEDAGSLLAIELVAVASP